MPKSPSARTACGGRANVYVTFLRSSSIGAYEWCEHSHYLASQIGVKRGTLVSTEIGSCTHKVLELLAQGKLAQQKNEPSFLDPELGMRFSTNLTVEDYIEFAYAHYSNPANTEHVWDKDSRKDVEKHVWTALNFGGGTYDPRKLDIVAPELYFDLEIRQPWAYYDYRLPDGSRLKGYLRIKGTMDLIHRVAPGEIRYVDWKTGRWMNWKTRCEKGFAELCKEPQFLLYNYALHRLFPDDYVSFSVFYLKKGGPDLLYFGANAIEDAESMLRASFEEMRDCKKPALVAPSWKCGKCSYSTERYDSEDNVENKSVCQFFRDELLSIGMDKVFAKFGDVNSLQAYGSGGGATNREESSKQ